MASARPRKRSLSSGESSDAGSDEVDVDASRREQHQDAHRNSEASHNSGSYTKVQRTFCDPSTSSASSQSAFTCSLPPLCSSSPKAFATSEALTSHYSTHHAHVCSAPRCNKIFPSEHFLDLHLREFHDPIVALQRENGSKTYKCFALTCDKKFSSPKKRRLHLVDYHKYPKEFFFALPMHGLEQLYSRFGDSASLVGPVYKGDKENSAEPETHSTLAAPSSTASIGRASGVTPPPEADTGGAVLAEGGVSHAEKVQHKQQQGRQGEAEASVNSPDATQQPDAGLEKTMQKLTLVPPSMRFGRGKGNRFTSQQRPKAANSIRAPLSALPNGDSASLP